MPQLVITAVGPDRPGIVGDLTGHLHRAGANIADSRMVNLRGQFALILLVEGSAEVLDRARDTLHGVASEIGLTIEFAAQAGPREVVTGVPYRLKTYSMDQPGIVHGVTDLLRRHHVNIEELQTRLGSAPFAGTPLFTMEMRLTIPPAVPLRELRRELEDVCASLNCDVDLEPA